MKILRTDEEYRESIMKILRSKPKYFYLSTFNIFINNEVLEMFELMKKVKDVRVIVGLVDPSPKQLLFLKNTFVKHKIPVKLVTNFHMKTVTSDKKTIVGGRNLTKSNWVDLSFEIVAQESVVKMKDEFDKIYKKLQSIL